MALEMPDVETLIPWKRRATFVSSGDEPVTMSTDMQSAGEICTLHSPVELSLLGFPEKLWNLVNNPKCEEVVWSEDGKCIVIPNTQQFICNVLNNPSKQIFKTKNFSSFIRQLNLYGFRKVTEHRGKAAHSEGNTVSSKCKFKHPFFQSGRRDFLAKVKRKYESMKKGADSEVPKLAAQPRVESFLRESCESGIYFPWNPPVLYPTAPFFPALAPPMLPFQPAFQFPEVPHGGNKDFSALGRLPCQLEYGPYTSMFPLSTSPLAPERTLRDTRETIPVWNDAQSGRTPGIPAKHDSRKLKPSLESPRRGRPQPILHNSPDSSVAQVHGNPNHTAVTCPWRVLPETKQPLPAQKSTAELTAPATCNDLALDNGEETSKGFNDAASTISEEELHCKKRKLLECDKCSVFSVSDPPASPI